MSWNLSGHLVYPISYYTKGGLYANDKKLDSGVWVNTDYTYAKATDIPLFPSKENSNF